MEEQAKTEFDFDEWAELAASDPETFEKRRRAAVDFYILSQPEKHQHRLRQLQWKIDAVRSASPNPLASCVRLYDLMMERAYGEGGLLDSLNAVIYKDSSKSYWSREKEGAKIFPLKPQGKG